MRWGALVSELRVGILEGGEEDSEERGTCGRTIEVAS